MSAIFWSCAAQNVRSGKSPMKPSGTAPKKKRPMPKAAAPVSSTSFIRLCLRVRQKMKECGLVAGHVRIFVTEVLDLKYKLLSTKWRSLWLCLPFIVQVLLCSFLSAPAQVSLDSRLVQESKLPASAAFVWDWSSVFRRYRTPQVRLNDWRTQFKWPSRL